MRYLLIIGVPIQGAFTNNYIMAFIEIPAANCRADMGTQIAVRIWVRHVHFVTPSFEPFPASSSKSDRNILYKFFYYSYRIAKKYGKIKINM